MRTKSEAGSDVALVPFAAPVVLDCGHKAIDGVVALASFLSKLVLCSTVVCVRERLEAGEKEVLEQFGDVSGIFLYMRLGRLCSFLSLCILVSSETHTSRPGMSPFPTLW